TASTTLLLPDPFGPTMPVMPGAKSNRVLSANDLNPTSSRRVSMVSEFRVWSSEFRVFRVRSVGRPAQPTESAHPSQLQTPNSKLLSSHPRGQRGVRVGQRLGRALGPEDPARVAVERRGGGGPAPAPCARAAWA